MFSGVLGYGPVLTIRKRITPTDALTLNSSPILALAGTPGIFRLVIGGTAFIYTGSTPYNEVSALVIRQGGGEAITDLNFTDNGLNSTITAAIVTDGSTCFGAAGINDANNLTIATTADLTGGDLGWDVTIFYVNVKVY